MAELRIGGATQSDFQAAEVIVAELISNAFRHGDGIIRSEISWDDGNAVLHLVDRGCAFRIPGPPAGGHILQQSGWGLMLVAKLARKFEVENTGKGNAIRVILPVKRKIGSRRQRAG